MQLFTYEMMPEIIGLTHAKDVMCIHCEKRPSAQLFDLHGRVRMQIFSCEDVSVYNLCHNFLCLGSTDMFPRSCPLQDVFMRVFTH